MALKEWNVVCEAIRQGQQIVLARKGGIAEPEGEFQLPRTQFWLYPTFFHEAATRLNARGQQIVRDQPHLAQPPQSTTVPLDLVCQVTDVVYLDQIELLDHLAEEQILDREALEMRFHYRQPGLYALVIRAWQVETPFDLQPTEQMLGCRSWVELDQGLPLVRKAAVLQEAEFERRRKILLSALTQ